MTSKKKSYPCKGACSPRRWQSIFFRDTPIPEIAAKSLGAVLPLVLMGAVVLALFGCARTALFSGPEPQRIVIRNATGVDLEYVYLGPESTSFQSGTRYAAIAPVPKGVSQQAVRSTSAPALPKKVMVKYRPVTGEDRSQLVDVRSALRQAGGDDRQALVFLIRPDFSVEVLLE